MMEEGTPPREAELRAELAALKPRGLQKRAEAAGVSEEDLDAVEDSAGIIELILQKVAEKEAAVAAAADPMAPLRAELAALKPRALQKRAEAVGVNEDALDEATDSDAIVTLIVSKVQAEQEAAQAVAKRAKLEAELMALKPRALQRRAEAEGVTEDQLDNAESDAEIIGLIVQKAGFSDTGAAPAKAHYGLGDSNAAPTKAAATTKAGVEDAGRNIFGTKHVILSYQWDVSTSDTRVAPLACRTTLQLMWDPCLKRRCKMK